MDTGYLLFLQGIRTDWGGEGFFTVVSALPTSALAAAIPAILFWCLNKPAGLFILFNAQVGRVINELIKNTLCVYRPWIKDAELLPSAEAMAKASSFSFPSGHTQFATAIYGGFAFFFRKILAKPIIALFALIVLFVAFSRNFLGVHTPQDVLFAMIYSVGLFFAAEKLFAWMGKDPERRLTVFAGGLLATLLVFAWLYFKPYPEDMLDGQLIVDPLKARADAFDALGFGLSFFLGWFLEQKFINFKTNVSAKRRLWRIIIGFAILGVIAVIFYPLMKYFLSVEAYKFFKAFLPFFAILFAIPWAFTKAEQRFKL